MKTKFSPCGFTCLMVERMFHRLASGFGCLKPCFFLQYSQIPGPGYGRTYTIICAEHLHFMIQGESPQPALEMFPKAIATPECLAVT